MRSLGRGILLLCCFLSLYPLCLPAHCTKYDRGWYLRSFRTKYDQIDTYTIEYQSVLTTKLLQVPEIYILAVIYEVLDLPRYVGLYLLRLCHLEAGTTLNTH